MVETKSYRSRDPKSFCRPSNVDGVWYENGDEVDWDYIKKTGFDELTVGCMNDHQGNKFLRQVSDMGNDLDWEYKRKSHSSIPNGDCFFVPWGYDRNVYKFKRKQRRGVIADCCSKYTSGSGEQSQNCSEEYCINSDKCKKSFSTACTSFSDDLLKKLRSLKPTQDINDNTSNLLVRLGEGMNNKTCEEWYSSLKGDEKIQRIKYITDIESIVNIIIEKLKTPYINIELQKKLIDLLLTPAVKIIAKHNSDTFSKLLTDFCNDDTIFKKKGDWEKLTDTYGGICNCYWDPIKDNGNPVNKEHTIIKDMQDLKGISATEKSYLQVATDIKTAGKPNCWYNKCIANQGLTIDDIEQKCPLINIATCLSKANLENKGIINAEKVEIIAKCKSEINSDWFKSNSQNKCFVTGFEDKKYLQNMCKIHNDCSMCSDIDKYMNSKEFKDLKSLSCQTNKSPDKNDLKNRCSEIQKKSDSKTDCEWCSDIDKYIKSQIPSPSPSPTPPPDDDSGLSNKAIFGIVVGIIVLIFMIIGLIMFI
tara:strand:- start:42 stop:1640 length:1599 start_codon:yes stop_codon:yes gene_type:complete